MTADVAANDKTGGEAGGVESAIPVPPPCLQPLELIFVSTACHLAQPGALGCVIWVGHRPLQHAQPVTAVTAQQRSVNALHLPPSATAAPSPCLRLLCRSAAAASALLLTPLRSGICHTLNACLLSACLQGL
jgi:hypothetical protein